MGCDDGCGCGGDGCGDGCGGGCDGCGGCGVVVVVSVCGCVSDSNCGSVTILIGSNVYIFDCVFCRSNYIAKWPSKIDFLRHICSFS